MSAEEVFGPEPLGPAHQLDGFDCGVESLNEYLRRFALGDLAAGKSRTYVIARGERVVGYFSLAMSSVSLQDATERVAAGQGGQPIPAILIGRLAIDKVEQGRGFGEALLVEALRKSVAAAQIIGARAVFAHALDEHAKSFYLKYGFESSPCHDLLVMLLMKDVRKTFGV